MKSGRRGAPPSRNEGSLASMPELKGRGSFAGRIWYFRPFFSIGRARVIVVIFQT